MARSSRPSTAAISQRRPTRVDSAARSAIPVRHAQQPPGGDRFVGTFDVDHLGLTEHRRASTSRAVDALSITPPGGATDSIRCAMPTCSPTAV